MNNLEESFHFFEDDYIYSGLQFQFGAKIFVAAEPQ